jgi:hypothetical protein
MTAQPFKGTTFDIFISLNFLGASSMGKANKNHWRLNQGCKDGFP